MKNEEILIQTPDVKVRLLTLGPAEAGPPHRHTEIKDHMFGISGEIVVTLRHPDEEVVLTPGVRCEIEPGRVHGVRNGLESEPSEYLLVQGVGAYDFIREPGEVPGR